MKSISASLILSTLLIALSCSPEGKKEDTSSKDPNVRVIKEFYPDGRLKSSTEALGKLRHGESKEYRKDGTLENLITYENNRKQGPAINFYADGKTVKTEINYTNGYKQGDSKWFFPNGKIYRLTPYENGRIQGIRKLYYESGTLQAEIRYSKGQPGVGLKEYNPDGSLKKFNASIVFSEQDRISMDNTFKVSISLSEGSRNVEFYQGELTEGKFWNDQLAPIPTENGIGVLEYYVSRGMFKMETFTVIARVKTSLGNYHFLVREYHLAIENKF